MNYENYAKESVESLTKQIKEIIEREIYGIVNDLKCDVDHAEEELRNYKSYVEDNMIERKMSDYTGDSYDDRF